MDNLGSDSIADPMAWNDPQLVLAEEFLIPVRLDATGTNPAIDNFKGNHNFDIILEDKGGSDWTYAAPPKEILYIKMNHKIQIGFQHYDHNNASLFLRAQLVFLNSKYFTTPVRRCYVHRNPKDAFNEGYAEATDHVVRFDDPTAVYQKNDESGRYSVVVSLGPKQNGTDKVYKSLSFMCLNSCVGIKRPIAIIFTLEDQYCNVLGRRTLNVKVCSGPKRDRNLAEDPLNQVKKSKKRKSTSVESAEDRSNVTTITIPNKILKAVTSYADLRLRELYEDENRKPDETEKECLKQFHMILQTLRQERKAKN